MKHTKRGTKHVKIFQSRKKEQSSVFVLVRFCFWTASPIIFEKLNVAGSGIFAKVVSCLRKNMCFFDSKVPPASNNNQKYISLAQCCPLMGLRRSLCRPGRIGQFASAQLHEWRLLLSARLHKQVLFRIVRPEPSTSGFGRQQLLFHRSVCQS